ncbi:hypothetical protein [Nonomuraea sediminis]|uniref:hypothetical protein n=1 Tax=Nonomuraea sediminis TaxID=2835864 RepID=UPI001BDD559D|nr:hypothetical protein [Nonomuraea sediminis]
MSNGVRHALGVVAGLLLTPLIAAGLTYGVGSVSMELARFYRAPWLGFGVLALTAIVLAFLLGSRISPIASLMGGLTFTVVGIIPLIEMSGVRVLPDRLLPGTMGIGLQSLLYPGVLLLLGVTMLAVSAFPSRWRSSRPAVPLPPVPYGGPSPYPPGPPGPAHLPNAPQGTPAPEDATRPMQRE